MLKRVLFVGLAVCLVIGLGCSKRVPLSPPFGELKVKDTVYIGLEDETKIEGQIGTIEEDEIQLRVFKMEKGTDPPEMDFLSLSLKKSAIQTLSVKRTQTGMTLVVIIIILVIIVVVVLVMKRKPAQA